MDDGADATDGISRATHRAAFVAENYPDPALILGPFGEVRWANAAAERLFGMTVDEFAGQSVLDRVHPDDVQHVALSMVSVQDKDVGTLIEARVDTPTGWRLLEVRGASVGDDLVLSVRDLTDRNRWDVAGRDAERARSLLRYGAFLAFQLDDAGVVLSSSPAMTRLLGHDQEGVDGHPFENLIDPTDRPGFRACLDATIAQTVPSTSTRQTCEVHLRGFEGALVPHLLSLVNLLDDPTVGAIVLSGQDITARVAAEHGLRHSHSLLEATLEATTEGIVVTDRIGRVTDFNRRFADIWNLPADVMARGDAVEMMDHIVPQVLNPAGFLARVDALNRDPECEEQDTIELRDGRVIERTSRPQHLGDTVVGRVYCFRDISAERRLRSELTHQAFHDSLTQLANQALFRDRVEHALRGLDRTDRTVAVLFIDIDDFKLVNDSLGHAAGDDLLRMLAKRLRDTVRRHDTVARLGGDEFAVLLEVPVDLALAQQTAERLIDAIRQPLTIQGTELVCGASVGVALGTDRTTEAELLRSADLAMYSAKARGKGHHRVFASEMHDAAMARLGMEAALQRAVRDHQLVVHYQPVWTIPDRRIEAVEALIRWDHPERGMLGPAEFIPHAEESGFIDQIGQYVLARACDDLKRWSRALPAGAAPRVSVNVSTRQLLQRSLADRIDSVVGRAGVDPTNLILEVTESSLMKDPDLAGQSLGRLHELGFRLAVDDFGTGYSSLAYLQRFPIDFLKIDRVFIEHVTDQDRSLVTAIIQLARTLNLTPVAEGVETEEQLDTLIELGCDLAQGFLLARPADADRILELLMATAASRV